MNLLFTFTFLILSSSLFCQISYTGLDPDPLIEKEKKEKEVFFKSLRDDAFFKLQNCTKQCGSYAADANNPKDPCNLPGSTPRCICACNTKYNETILSIDQQEKSWRATILKKEEDYRNSKINEQQHATDEQLRIKEKEQPTEEQLKRQEREEERERKEKLQERLEAEKEKERKRLEEQQAKNMERTTSATPSYRTPEQQKEDALKQKIDETNTKNAALQQGLKNAITATGNMIQSIVAAKRRNDEIKAKKIEKATNEYNRELDEMESEQFRKKFVYQDNEAWSIKEFISTKNIATYYRYKAYADYIVDQHFSIVDSNNLYIVFNTFFRDTMNKEITPFEFCSFLEVITWADGSIIKILDSESFAYYLKKMRGLAFADLVFARINDLIYGIKSIAGIDFFAMGGGGFRSKFGASDEYMFGKISYYKEARFPVYFADSTRTLQVLPEQSFLNFSFELHKDFKKEHLLTPEKGTITAVVKKLNSFHVTHTNYTYGISPDSTNENAIIQTQMMRKVPQENVPEYLGCLVKLNVDLEYSGSFGKIEFVQANIYLFRSIQLTKSYSDGSSENYRYYVGYVDDIESKNDTPSKSVLHDFLNTSCRYYNGGMDDIIRYYQQTGHLCYPLYGISGLSLILISADEIEKSRAGFFKK